MIILNEFYDIGKEKRGIRFISNKLQQQQWQQQARSDRSKSWNNKYFNNYNSNKISTKVAATITTTNLNVFYNDKGSLVC